MRVNALCFLSRQRGVERGSNPRSVSFFTTKFFLRSHPFDKTELRDSRLTLYASYLPHGTYVFTYQLQATIPGQFQTMPAYAYPFYYPDMFGRSNGALMTIEPESDNMF
jgi:uncharacterized protein YfaS (alpha-2-macroglobulin family)